VTSNTQVGLSWKAPDARGGTIESYRVSYKTSDMSDFILLKEGITDTSSTITELSPTAPIQQGVTYTFVVAAKSERGYGLDSESKSIVAASAPAGPTEISATLKKSDDSMTLTWIAPGANGAIVEGYFVLIESKAEEYKKATCTFVNIIDTTCVINIASLRETPFLLENGDTLKIKM